MQIFQVLCEIKVTVTVLVSLVFYLIFIITALEILKQKLELFFFLPPVW